MAPQHRGISIGDFRNSESEENVTAELDETNKIYIIIDANIDGACTNVDSNPGDEEASILDDNLGTTGETLAALRRVKKLIISHGDCNTALRSFLRSLQS